MENADEVSNLVKRFGNITAVNSLSFSIKKGEIFGFLGPNGAGKTTTIRILTGLTKPTSGTALIEGFDISGYTTYAQTNTLRLSLTSLATRTWKIS